MDKTIHKHLDNRLDLQEASTTMLEEVFASMDVKALIKNPKAEFARVAHVAMGVAEAHMKDAAREGVRFAREVQEKGAITFKDTEDPKANEEDAPGGD